MCYFWPSKISHCRGFRPNNGLVQVGLKWPMRSAIWGLILLSLTGPEITHLGTGLANFISGYGIRSSSSTVSLIPISTVPFHQWHPNIPSVTPRSTDFASLHKVRAIPSSLVSHATALTSKQPIILECRIQLSRKGNAWYYTFAWLDGCRAVTFWWVI